MLTGRNTAFFCEINLKDNWDLFTQRVSNYKPRNNEDEVYITSTIDTIQIDEYYDTGIRYKGSKEIISNQSFTEIKKVLDKIHIRIEIERTFESRIITNVLTFLNLLFLTICIIETCCYIREYPNSNYNLRLTFLMELILIGILIIIWQLSRQRHLMIIKDIQKMINDTNPATNSTYPKGGLSFSNEH